MKKGFPPARAAIVRASASAIRGPPACRASATASSSPRGSRCSRTWLAAREPHPGRASSSSGRAAARTVARPGLWLARPASRSTRSIIGARIMCTSSNRSVTGASVASPATIDRTPDWTSWMKADSSRRSAASPSASARRSAVRSASSPSLHRSTSSRSRRSDVSPGSPCSMPAASRTIVAAGANVALPEASWPRPTRTFPGCSIPARNSSASRDFPIPGSPISVTSSGRDVASTRAWASRRSVSSFARPTKGIVRRAVLGVSPSTG